MPRIELKSLQESWLDTTDSATSELLLLIMAWVDQQERKRLSERVKAGLKGKKNVVYPQETTEDPRFQTGDE